MQYHLPKSTCNFVENLSWERYLVVLVRYVRIFDLNEKKNYYTVPCFVYKKLVYTKYLGCSKIKIHYMFVRTYVQDVRLFVHFTTVLVLFFTPSIDFDLIFWLMCDWLHFDVFIPTLIRTLKYCTVLVMNTANMVLNVHFVTIFEWFENSDLEFFNRFKCMRRYKKQTDWISLSLSKKIELQSQV